MREIRSAERPHCATGDSGGRNPPANSTSADVISEPVRGRPMAFTFSPARRGISRLSS
jgi:hypothetical protein